MTYSWFNLETVGVEYNSVYIDTNSVAWGSVTKIKGVITAFACNGQFKRSWKGVPTIKQAHQWVRKQYLGASDMSEKAHAAVSTTQAGFGLKADASGALSVDLSVMGQLVVAAWGQPPPVTPNALLVQINKALQTFTLFVSLNGAWHQLTMANPVIPVQSLF